MKKMIKRIGYLVGLVGIALANQGCLTYAMSLGANNRYLPPKTRTLCRVAADTNRSLDNSKQNYRLDRLESGHILTEEEARARAEAKAKAKAMDEARARARAEAKAKLFKEVEMKQMRDKGFKTEYDADWGYVCAGTTDNYYDKNRDGFLNINEMGKIEKFFKKGSRFLLYVGGDKEVKSFITIYDSNNKVCKDSEIVGSHGNLKGKINFDAGDYNYSVGVIERDGKRREVIKGKFRVMD